MEHRVQPRKSLHSLRLPGSSPCIHASTDESTRPGGHKQPSTCHTAPAAQDNKQTVADIIIGNKTACPITIYTHKRERQPPLIPGYKRSHTYIVLEISTQIAYNLEQSLLGTPMEKCNTVPFAWRKPIEQFRRHKALCD